MKSYQLILASQSPRRKELLEGLGIPFCVRVIEGIDESFPEDLPIEDIPVYISKQKASVYAKCIAEDEVVLTADTVVVCQGQVLGKPKDEDDARRMLNLLSGRTHEVITGVTVKTREEEKSFSVVTEVQFKSLTPQEIDFYIRRFKPFDKAGAYGIQEWIGYIGVISIHGSYFNVMGLPVQRIYEELKTFFPIS
ncbi:septum formation protein Maf [Prevotella sp. oral taxon 475]|uniref:Maf-like protein n=1 Tax=Prevotella sp. oral taxon 475 TaxID=712471 RepID=UPI001BA7C631|nr:Maf-like protein [Prevotella sp. oral taxon 475]QUB46431.1 septum formation protein Maf [Prevotella sp. oral taxon 475]